MEPDGSYPGLTYRTDKLTLDEKRLGAPKGAEQARRVAGTHSSQAGWRYPAQKGYYTSQYPTHPGAHAIVSPLQMTIDR